MEVIITKAQLEACGACSKFLASPEWDPEQEALVYSDWDETVARHLVSKEMLGLLGFLVTHKLVPMTQPEYQKLRQETRRKLRKEEV